ncbi:MAG TPA: YihY/virulence factor BrkB family protein, partial [Terriglobales bacterium]|nr:YihY/virulence factor BrkB family protein [Terriglobales bacterium]
MRRRWTAPVVWAIWTISGMGFPSATVSSLDLDLTSSHDRGHSEAVTDRTPRRGNISLDPTFLFAALLGEAMAAGSAWKLGGLSVKELGRRVWREFNEDEVMDRSAALSYYFLGSLFPLMLVGFSILGYLAGPGSQLREAILQHASMVLPGTADALIDKTLNEVMNASGGGKISFGIIASIWTAATGVAAVMSALNVVYDIRETRSYFRSRLIATGLMIAMSVCIVVGLAIALSGGTGAEWVGNRMNAGPVFVLAWRIIQWGVVALALLFAFALLYYFGPNLRDQHWEWVTPGSVIGFALWLAVSLGLKVYISHFN